MECEQKISKESFAWILGSLCRLHHIPFNARLLLQRHPPDENGRYTVADVLNAAEELNFRTGAVAADTVCDFPAITLPCLAFLREPGEEPVATEHAQGPRAEERGWAIPILVARSEEGRVFYFEAGCATLKECSRDEFVGRLDPVLHLFALKPAPVRDRDGAELAMEKPFGFGWFVPELLRHREVWRDILAASLALQLVGLAMPLFTQVVIDKVVVHQTRSTLVAVGVGLGLSIAFSAIFSWVRQYLVLHTGNRIDAVLGSRVFAHLLKLPIHYFAHRPPGILVARLQGVESIREFLSGAAVTLVLDLPFMIILLAVMFWYR